MKKILERKPVKNIIAGAIIGMGTLILPSCDLAMELIKFDKEQKELDEQKAGFDDTKEKWRSSPWKPEGTEKDKLSFDTGMPAQNSKLEDYFLNKDERQQRLVLTKYNSYGRRTFDANPYIMTKEEIGDKPVKTGVASYRFTSDKIPKSINLTMIVFRFDSEESAINEIKTKKLYSNPLFEHFFLADKTVSYFKINQFSDTSQQVVQYIDILLNYQRRFNAKIVLSPEENITPNEYLEMLKTLRKNYSISPDNLDKYYPINPASMETLKGSILLRER